MVRQIAACGLFMGAGFYTPALRAQPLTHLGVSQAELQQLSIIRRARVAGLPEGVDVPLTLDGKAREIILTRHSIRGANFRVYAIGADNQPVEVPMPPADTYTGYIDGEPGSAVAASYADGRLKALIRRGDGRLWCVQPLHSTDKAAVVTHAVFETTDILAGDETCATADGPGLPGESGGGVKASAATASAGLHVAEVAFDADYEYYTANGSSVPETMADIEDVMNGVNLIYERDTSITHQLGTILVRTDPADPYTNSAPSALLDEFQAEWNANQGAIPRDVAHLMTGRDLDDTTIGIAFVSVICSAYSGYGLSQSKYTSNYARRVGLTAHELGHNWSAPHCGCNIMCSSIGGCLGDVTSFTQESIDAIVAHRDTRTCLDVLLPDLVVGGVIGPDPLVVGDTALITMTITNRGNFAASNIVLTANLPAATPAISFQPGPPAGMITGSLFTAQLGRLDIGAATTATVNVSALVAGSLTSHVSVTSAGDDLEPGDNDLLLNAFVTPVLLLTPADPLSLNGRQGEALPCTTYTLANQGTSLRDWTATSGGLATVAPSSGTLAAGSSTDILVCVVASGLKLYAGHYTDALTVTDTAGGHEEDRPVDITIEPVAVMPLSEDFESVSLPAYWKITGTGNFRTECTSEFSPHGGTQHLTMDDSVAGGSYSRNEVTLFMDLEHYTNVLLTFWAREYGDEPHAPAGPFTGGADFDGVAVSADGITWNEVQPLRSLSETYAFIEVDLDAAVSALGLSYSKVFRIRFNQYDNYGITSDGIAIDDVTVTGDGPVADFDEDGLPDTWEAAYYGGGTNGLALADGDGDGLLNVEEYLLDTSPTNANVPLGVGIARTGERLLDAIITPSSDARVYSVDYTPDPRLGTWQQVVTNAPGSNAVTTVTTPGKDAYGIYRVRVSVP